MINEIALFTSGLFFVAAIWIAYVFHPMRKKLLIDVRLAIAIPTIAGLAYFWMGLDLGTIDIGGRTFFLVRYLDWIPTTALIAFLTTSLLYNSIPEKAPYKKVVVANTITIVCGMIAATVDRVPALMLYIVGSATYVYILYVWYRVLHKYPKKVDEFVKFTVWFNSILWSLYPVLFVLQEPFFGVVEDTSSSIMYNALDLSAKLVFVFMFLKSQETLAEGKRLEVMVEEINEKN